MDAIAALEDPSKLEESDTRSEYGEERIKVIGIAHRSILFVATTTPGEDFYRIISARKANRHAQDRYYAGDREAW